MRILFLLIISVFGFKSLAQKSSITLSGEIKGKATQEAVPYVSVSLKSKTDNTFS